jgi:hypothetical protein
MEMNNILFKEEMRLAFIIGQSNYEGNNDKESLP